MVIYQIDSSARKKGSTSRALAKKLLEKIKKEEDTVVYRDLDDEMLFVAGLTESGMSIPESERTVQQKKMFNLSDKLIEELKLADTIIISVPVYNFGPPATLKAWSDLVARVKSTFKYSKEGKQIGLLENKIVYIIITSGGTKVNGPDDFLTPWLVHVLNFFGINNIKVIAADQMAINKEKSIKYAEDLINNLF
jgi:FMN-dependent NADH-azoreductase